METLNVTVKHENQETTLAYYDLGNYTQEVCDQLIDEQLEKWQQFLSHYPDCFSPQFEYVFSKLDYQLNRPLLVEKQYKLYRQGSHYNCKNLYFVSGLSKNFNLFSNQEINTVSVIYENGIGMDSHVYTFKGYKTNGKNTGASYDHRDFATTILNAKMMEDAELCRQWMDYISREKTEDPVFFLGKNPEWPFYTYSWLNGEFLCPIYSNSTAYQEAEQIEKRFQKTHNMSRVI